MPNLEERIAFLEGRVTEHAKGMDGVREAIVHLEQSVDRRIHGLEERMDRRFLAVDQRFGGLEQRIGSLEDKVSRYFVWLVGIQVTTLAAIVAALVARP